VQNAGERSTFQILNAVGLKCLCRKAKSLCSLEDTQERRALPRCAGKLAQAFQRFVAAEKTNNGQECCYAAVRLVVLAGEGFVEVFHGGSVKGDTDN
jgi:hypothetical protein